MNVLDKVKERLSQEKRNEEKGVLKAKKLKLKRIKDRLRKEERAKTKINANIVNGKEFLPIMVSDFDKLLSRRGVERGNTIMISGGSGTGKSTFCLQSIYKSAIERGEKGLYLSFEEKPENLKRHMKQNFGWDFDALESRGLVKFKKIDPFSLSRQVESELAKKKGELLIKTKGLIDVLPKKFKPDRVCVDSLSALSAGFMDEQETYRLYLSTFIDELRSLNSVNILIGETEQEPVRYSRSGIEEFLVDGVVVLYNIRHDQMRQQAIEILKLRCSAHLKKMIPYKIISGKGIEIYIEGKIFL